MSIYNPYVYLIGWSALDRWYYGCSYSKSTRIANPDNLWKTYFTSSRIVKNYRKLYGEPDIVEIRKVFKTADEALLWESKVIRRLKMVDNEKFLNQKDMSGRFRNKGGYTHTNKSIDNYKKSFTEKRKAELSIITSENNKKRSPEIRKKAAIKTSETRKQNKERYTGINSPRFKVSRTDAEKISISLGTKIAMNDPELSAHLSKKAKERCTPEWKNNVAERNKFRVCCIKCQREMGKSSLGKHRLGKKCI